MSLPASALQVTLLGMTVSTTSFLIHLVIVLLHFPPRDSTHRQARLLFRLEKLTPKPDLNPRQGCSVLRAGVDDFLQVPGVAFCL